jgi:hypothetical protein
MSQENAPRRAKMLPRSASLRGTARAMSQENLNLVRSIYAD